MKVVDPHLHLWRLDTIHYPWLQSPRQDWLLSPYDEISKSYKLDDFLHDAGEIEVVKIVHIESASAPSDRLKESQWLQSIAEDRSSGGLPNGFVAAADLSDPRVEEELTMQKSFPGLRGIRQILNVSSNPRHSFVDHNFMSDPSWRAGFGLLQKLGLSFDLQIYPSQMAEAAELARDHPETTIVLNHTGMFVDRNSVGKWRTWRDGMRALARNPNVAVKISGMGMADRNWTVESIRPYVLEAVDSFGTERCMFASNFPVDRLYSSYSSLWRAFEACVSGCSEPEKAMLFRTNAERVYRI